MSNELTFEDLTGNDSVEKWTEEYTDKELKSITQIAEKQISLQQEVTSIEERLKAKKADLRLVSEQLLPEAMQSANLMEFVTASGFKISVSPFYQAYISADNSETAFKWLEDNGHGDLIKNQISISFGKSENEKAKDTIATLRQKGLSPSIKLGVHPQTLKAFVKEQLTNGKDIPSEPFGIYVGSRSKIVNTRK